MTVETRPLDALAQALAALPTDAHRSTFRLLLAAVVTRWHLGPGDPSGWPSFVLVGPSKTAKTLLALGACRLFGLDPARSVRTLPAETERSCWGRLSQGAGGTWRFTPAAALGFPLVAWDEHDKAPRDVQRAVLRMLQGEVAVAGEGDQPVLVRPTVILTGNGRPEHVPAEYLRRAVVLDTTPLVGDLGDVHRSAGSFLSSLPRLELDALRPSVADVPTDAAETILATARAGLSEAGWRACDERSLLHLTLGMATLRGDNDLLGAGLAVVGDYLACARTVSETADPVPAVVPDATLQAAEAARRRARQVEQRRQAREAELELAAARAEMLSWLDESTPDIDKYHGAERAEARAIVERLAVCEDWITQAASVEELDEIHGEVVDCVNQAGGWIEQHDGYLDAEAWEDDEEDIAKPRWDADTARSLLTALARRSAGIARPALPSGPTPVRADDLWPLSCGHHARTPMQYVGSHGWVLVGQTLGCIICKKPAKVLARNAWEADYARRQRITEQTSRDNWLAIAQRQTVHRCPCGLVPPCNLRVCPVG